MLPTSLRLAALLSVAFVVTPLLQAREPWLAPDEVAQQKNPLTPNKEVIERGKVLYQDHCVDCHGRKGKGDGPGAADLNVRPIDLAQPSLKKQTDGSLFWKISNGRKPMPSYKRKLSDEERWTLVTYLRTFSVR